MEKGLVLIVEDEPEIEQILNAYLEREGYRTVRAGDGETALQHHALLSPDVVLLDIRLPKMDGFSVLGRLRLGTDDYIVKPFNPQEVVARVKAVLRRTNGAQSETVRRFGNFEVDFEAYSALVYQDERRVTLQLTLSEFRILAYMIRRPAYAFERDDILDAYLPESGALARTVDTHISNLLRKLEELGQSGFFSAVRGIGYRFCDPKGSLRLFHLQH